MAGQHSWQHLFPQTRQVSTGECGLLALLVSLPLDMILVPFKSVEILHFGQMGRTGRVRRASLHQLRFERDRSGQIGLRRRITRLVHLLHRNGPPSGTQQQNRPHVRAHAALFTQTLAESVPQGCRHLALHSSNLNLNKLMR